MCKAADCLRNRPCMVFLFLHLWLEGPESSQYRLVHRLERLQAGWGKLQACRWGAGWGGALVKESGFLDDLSPNARA